MFWIESIEGKCKRLLESDYLNRSEKDRIRTIKKRMKEDKSYKLNGMQIKFINDLIKLHEKRYDASLREMQ